MNECKGCGRPIAAPQQVYCNDDCYDLAHGLGKHAAAPFYLPDRIVTRDEVRIANNEIARLRAMLEAVRISRDEARTKRFDEGYAAGQKAERERVVAVLFKHGLKG